MDDDTDDMLPDWRSIIAGMHAVGWPFGGLLLWLLWQDRHQIWDQSSFYLGLVCAYAGLVIVIGGTMGRVAQRLVGRSSVPVTWMSITLGLLFDFVIFGWMIVYASG